MDAILILFGIVALAALFVVVEKLALPAEPQQDAQEPYDEVVEEVGDLPYDSRN